MKAPAGILALALVTLAAHPSAMAQGGADEGRVALAKAMGAVKVTLETGLAASSAHGKPISAKFEIEDGTLQLSVYTEKGGQFFEVVVDHATGKVAKTEAITEGEDLAAAKEQSQWMAKAKQGLHAAVAKAAAANKGFRAVSVLPGNKDGRPVATVTLVKGQDWKEVAEALD